MVLDMLLLPPITLKPMNGLAERMVRTVKGQLEYSSDPYESLLSYTATSLPWCGLSPAELLRKHYTPEIKQTSPQWPYLDSFNQSDEKFKLKQRENCNQQQVRELPQLATRRSVSLG